MRLYNSLSREIENFSPFSEEMKVGVYTCGPTVHHFLTIGNWRTYTLGDILVRTLKFLGYQVTYVMNITDVGHLTGDNLGDADTGEDRMEKAVLREGGNAWDIAKFYTKDFMRGFKQLNIIKPDVFCKATDHIPEQIKLVQQLEAKGLTYKIDDGIYFDTKEYASRGNRYGKLSTLDQIKEGARVESNPNKRDPKDFALWKLSPVGSKRHMEWDSPWGIGFPGWHIECSAMSMKYLGEQFDIHLGGEDLRSTHHPNEIAQSEAATGKIPFVKYWMHGAFLLVNGGRMGKSMGNAFTLDDIVKNQMDPIALRYFYLTGHYRKQLNFTWDALEAAMVAYNRLVGYVARMKKAAKGEKAKSKSDRRGVHSYMTRFANELQNDLSMPKALAVMWELVKEEKMGAKDKLEVLMTMDSVLGLNLKAVKASSEEVIPEKVMKLVEERENLRVSCKFEEADRVRDEILALGFEVEDKPGGSKLKKVARKVPSKKKPVHEKS